MVRPSLASNQVSADYVMDKSAFDLYDITVYRLESSIANNLTFVESRMIPNCLQVAFTFYCRVFISLICKSNREKSEH